MLKGKKRGDGLRPESPPGRRKHTVSLRQTNSQFQARRSFPSPYLTVRLYFDSYLWFLLLYFEWSFDACVFVCGEGEERERLIMVLCIMDHSYFYCKM